ncbi:MAG: TolC family protein [Nitrospirae bacterium]|nr:TolC family protein [Candidatus Troglogloeales bacterium]
MKFFCPIACFIFIFSSVAAGEETVTLSSLIEEAQKNNPALTALRLHQETVKEEISQSTFLDDPQLTLTQWGIPRDLNIGRSDQTWLGIEQSFPYPGKRLLKRKIATNDWEIAQQEYQAKRLEVTAEIESAYYNLLLIDKTIDLHQEHQSILNEFVEIAEKKYAVGQATQQDLLKAEVELAKLHNGRLTLGQDRIVTRAKINALLNRPDSTPIGRPEQLAYRPLPFLYDTLTQEALNNQNNLKSARFRVEKSEAMKTLTKKATLPDFTIGLSYWNVHGGTSPASDENQWMAMGKMNLPWVFGEKYNAKNRIAALEEDTAKAEYNALKNETLSQIKTIFTKIKTDEQLMDSYENNLIPLAKQSLAAAQIGYQSGKTDFLNFIDSQRTLLDLQMEYYMQLTDYWQQVAMLSPLIGNEINP